MTNQTIGLPQQQYHLAQINIALMKAPLDDPIMTDLL